MFNLLQTQVANNEGFMVQNGKIFLVMTIVSIILIGLFVYVASIDKKISQLEKK
jgi:CcmD family protein